MILESIIRFASEFGSLAKGHLRNSFVPSTNHLIKIKNQLETEVLKISFYKKNLPPPSSARCFPRINLNGSSRVLDESNTFPSTSIPV